MKKPVDQGLMVKRAKAVWKTPSQPSTATSKESFKGY